MSAPATAVEKATPRSLPQPLTAICAALVHLFLLAAYCDAEWMKLVGGLGYGLTYGLIAGALAGWTIPLLARFKKS